jgi:nitrate reductase cytochrome c-type subunit
MKGQFILISSVMIGFIVISAASTISEVQERNFESDSTENTVEMLKEEAQKIDHTDDQEVRNYIQMVSSVTEYETETNHWETNSCFNVTLTKTDGQLRLNCIG